MATLENKSNEQEDFRKKVWIFCAIAAFFILVIWIIKASFNVLLLILAGALIAIFFRYLGQLIHRKTGLAEKGSLIIAVIGTFVLIGLLVWFLGAKIQTQIAQLSDTLPATVDKAKQQLNKTTLGQKIVEYASKSQQSGKLSSFAKTFFRSTFGVLGDVYVVLFIGIFFTVDPQIYRSGFVNLIPRKQQPKAKEVLQKIGDTLSKWLKGKFFAMAVVAVLTAIGLSIAGIPMALALALIAGLLNFVPNFGPLIAMVPAVLISLTISPNMALIIACMYIAIQVIESNFITPLVQKQLIKIPPALIIIAQLFMGVFTGGWGVILATPIVAILIVIIQELYLKKQNDTASE